MKHRALNMLLMSFIDLSGQKKSVPAAFSPKTGISLPEESKQDSEGLVIASAGALPEYEREKCNPSINQTQVLSPAQVLKVYDYTT